MFLRGHRLLYVRICSLHQLSHNLCRLSVSQARLRRFRPRLRHKHLYCLFFGRMPTKLSLRAEASVQLASKPDVLATPTLPSDLLSALVSLHRRPLCVQCFGCLSSHNRFRGHQTRWWYTYTVTNTSRRRCAHELAPAQLALPPATNTAYHLKKIIALFARLFGALRCAAAMLSYVVPQPLKHCMSCAGCQLLLSARAQLSHQTTCIPRTRNLSRA